MTVRAEKIFTYRRNGSYTPVTSAAPERMSTNAALPLHNASVASGARTICDSEVSGYLRSGRVAKSAEYRVPS